MIIATASKVGIQVACPAAIVLPKVKSIAEKKPGPQAKRGTKFHKAIEHALLYQRRFRSGRIETMNEARDKAAELGIGDEFSKIPEWLAPDATKPNEIFLEKQYVLTKPTKPGRLLRSIVNGDQRDRNYISAETENHTCIVGTADAILRFTDRPDRDRFEIWDWKTGGNVPRPKDNWQLLFFAACLAPDSIDSGVEISGNIWYIDQGRVDSHTYTEEELLSAMSEFRRIIDIADSRTMMDTSPGEHCRYCPSKPLCPSHNLNIHRDPATTAEYVDQAFVLSQRAIDMEENLRAQIQNMKAPASVRGNNGLLFSKYEVRKEKLNGERAQIAIAGIPFLTTDQRNILGNTKMTKGAIEKLLGHEGAQRLFDELRAKGAFDTSSEERYGFRNEDE